MSALVAKKHQHFSFSLFVAIGMEHGCGACGELATKACKRCGTQYYCCVACQDASWHIHKAVCKILLSVELRNRPDALAKVQQEHVVKLLGSGALSGSGAEFHKNCTEMNPKEAGSRTIKDNAKEAFCTVVLTPDIVRLCLFLRACTKTTGRTCKAANISPMPFLHCKKNCLNVQKTCPGSSVVYGFLVYEGDEHLELQAHACLLLNGDYVDVTADESGNVSCTLFIPLPRLVTLKVPTRIYWKNKG